MIEENVEGEIVYNQPAGHVEDNESFEQTVIRESLEEAAIDFKPQHIIGIYQWRSPNNKTYIRVTYSGQRLQTFNNITLDTGIIQTLWLNQNQIQASQSKLRSPMVLKGINDYLSGQRYPLSLIHQFSEQIA